ncbi:MAG: HNH endonuclease [Solirubrobacteraceae bacterium]
MTRDGADCVWCRRELGPGHRDASLEHVVPRLKGGPAWPENEVCACRGCNRRRGHRSPATWLADCEEREDYSPTATACEQRSWLSTPRSPGAAGSGGRAPTSTASCGAWRPANWVPRRYARTGG